MTNKLKKSDYERNLKDWKYEVNRKLKYSGDADDKKKEIRVNPSKGDFINTVIHEDLHKKNWDLTEKEIRKRAKNIEKKLSVNEMIKILSKYKKRSS